MVIIYEIKIISEYRNVGLDKIEELEHDGAHAVKETGARRALEFLRERRWLHAIDLRRRIHLLLSRHEQHVDAFAFEAAPIRIRRSRVTVEVLVRPELQPVDEDAGDDGVAALARDPAQREVALVQIAHRRNECHALRVREMFRKFGGGVNDLHRNSVAFQDARLKNSRCPRIEPIRANKSLTCSWLSTKLSRSLLTIKSGASA